MIPYSHQSINDEDVEAVVDVLKSDYLTQGNTVSAFERVVREYTGAEYSVATNSGTSALHLACLALNLNKGDWLWTTPITFVASANCALYCGASVDFVDIDPKTFNMSTNKLKEKLEYAYKNKCLPKVLVVVHFCGLSCDMETIHALSEKFGFSIIEDACHALGGKYRERPIGCCQFSDVTIFSFHPVKSITTGEGGMIVTNNDHLAANIRLLSSHGITREPVMMGQKIDASWYYEQIALGYNYRLTDIQAALGITQMRRIDSFIERRHQIAKQYDVLLSGLPIEAQNRTKNSYSGMHLYVIRLQLDKISKTHSEIFNELRNNGIGVNLHYIPVHLQPWYQRMGFNYGDFPQAEKYYREAMTIPLFPQLPDDNVVIIVEELHKAIQ